MKKTNSKKLALSPKELYHACDLSLLPFNTTDEIEDITDSIGQPRALDALNFGIGMKHDGYNLYVSGSTGLGKHTVVKRLLERNVIDTPTPSDWCYINNFKIPHQPLALQLPAGIGKQLRNDMAQLVEDLLIAIPAAFESDEYRALYHKITEALTKQEENAFIELEKKAKKKNVTLIRTQGGYTIVPVRDDKVLSPEEFEKLPESDQEVIKLQTTEIEKELKEIIRQIPFWAKENRKKIKKLNQDTSKFTVEQFISELQNTYHDLPNVLSYLKAVNDDIIENVDEFRKHSAGESPVEDTNHLMELFSFFQINVLVDNSDVNGVPVIYEDNPTYNNLIGRVEHISQYGTLLTDFTLIKGGALHRANGGYLMLDAHKLLTTPFAWEALKRVLRAHEIRIESLEQMLSLVSTISLEPEPIPIDIKIILLGDRYLYYLLKEYDPEFNQLFKVAADFSEDLERNQESTLLYANWITHLQREHKLLSIDQGGIARIIEDCARKVEDGEKLSLHMGNLLDLLREADYNARKNKHEHIINQDVQQALDARVYRLDQLREHLHEQILRGTYLLDTQGSKAKQINALSVIQLGDYSFGRPCRITATAQLGNGKVIDIEREVKLGGAIHSKGVLILSSFLAGRYASNQPLSFSASLVFEQSYGTVDGDSASAAELCVLLSALTDLPLYQSIAITGSINQHGQIQAIGGVNEKIESFFDICNARGLTGEQGVIIPQSTIKFLMLRHDVVESAKQGNFTIYAVETIDQAMEIMTGLTAGELDDKGQYPEHSINRLVQDKLDDMVAKRKSFSNNHDESNQNDD